mgnify:CR=1 FL=1
MKGLRQKTLTNVIWSGVGQFGAYGLRYVIFLILAWVLSPSAIGLESLSTVAVLLAGELSTLGFESALIQHQGDDDLHYNVIFWASLIFSLVLAVLLIGFAEGISALLGDSRTMPLLKALSVIIPFRALTIIPGSRLSKSLRFKARTIIQFAEQIAYGGTALILAFTGSGVWSLVWGRIVMMIVRAGIMWSYEPWRPSLTFNWRVFRKMISFGFQSLSSNVLTRGLERVDYFLVGRFLGTQELGYYTLATQLAVVPVQRLVGAVQRVAFPALALVQNDLKKIRPGLLEVFKFLLVLLVPYTMFLLAFSLPVIEILYEEKWLPAVPLIQILALTGLFTAFDVSRAVFFARGRPGLWTGVTLSRILLFTAFALTVGLSAGSQGVAASLILSIGLTGFLSIFLAGRLVRLRASTLWEQIWRPVVGGLMMWVFWWGITRLTPLRVSDPFHSLVLGSVLAGVYIAFVFSEIKELFTEIFSRNGIPAVPFSTGKKDRDA